MKDEIQHIREARHGFDQSIAGLRADLHRFCTRMTGSVSEGEDAVQDVLMHAFYHLPELREGASLRSWLFRIAHNQCIDLLRRRKAFVPLEDQGTTSDEEALRYEHKQLAQRTLAVLFTQLPAKERACVVLKDVLGYDLEEAATITSSSIAAVKAAVHRGRQKLEEARSHSPSPSPLTETERNVIERYIERFNARDWEGVRSLLGSDAQLEVVERSAGPFATARYFENYASLPWRWRLALAEVEGSLAVVHFREVAGAWQPHSLVNLTLEGERITLVRDYVHVPYLLQRANLSAAR